MRNIESLRSLQKRIREATGPDRFLDADIWRKLIGDVLPPKNYPKLTLDPDGLGPCVALLEAVLPGHDWSRKKGFFYIWRSPDDALAINFTVNPVRLANDCLTFLEAIVSALIAQEEAKEAV